MSDINSEVNDILQKTVRESRELGEIKATLIANCEPGRVLHKLGIHYEPSISVIKNLVLILEQLVHKHDKLEKLVDDLGKYGPMLVHALGWLEETEPKWELDEPIDKSEFIAGLLERAHG